ncbi:MAG: sigma-70 family RNA polymerase sigma factor [Planctomycetes bacterium]|nr:sigma-70 family RNA polymerase sigma factor [Planctomycetota bacterium]
MDDDEVLKLIRSSVAGDTGAQSALVARLYPKVQTIVHRELEKDFRQRHKWILPLFSTRDIVHDVFAGVVAGLDESADFPNEAAFVGYLSTMVRNRLLDAVRHNEAGKRDVRRRSDASGTMIDRMARTQSSTPELAAHLAEQAEVLREVLDEFPDRHRALVTMRMMDGETFPVIAEKLGYASAETARQSFLDAQAKLLVKLRARGLS